MSEIDFDTIAKLAETAKNPQVSENILSIDGLLKREKDIEKLIGTADRLIKLIETSPSLSTLIRVQAAKSNVEIKPLRVEEKIQYVETGLKPQSELHQKVFEELNKLKPEELQNLLKQGENVKSNSEQPQN